MLSVGTPTASHANVRNHKRLLRIMQNQAQDLVSHTNSIVNKHNDSFKWRALNPEYSKLCSNASDHIDLPYPWFVYKPTWNCLAKERVGELFDGGKWHCNIGALAKLPKCVIYSFGSNADVGYETAISNRTSCEIHVFDPTIPKDKVQPLLPAGTKFHEIGLAGHTGIIDYDGGGLYKSGRYRVSTVQDIMERLGHAKINVLKIDIEGAEYDTIEALAKSGVLAHIFDEVFIEFHWRNLSATVQTFNYMMGAGFRIFSQEPNLFFREQPSAGIEYSFIHSRVADRYNL